MAFSGSVSCAPDFCTKIAAWRAAGADHLSIRAPLERSGCSISAALECRSDQPVVESGPAELSVRLSGAAASAGWRT